jgi:penicillin-insensitive murein endopeptidase
MTGRGKWSWTNRVGRALAMAVALGAGGCVGTPSPLAPGFRGSVGLPHQGTLTDGVALPDRGDGFVRFRKDGVKWGNPRLVSTIEGAARAVSQRAPGGAPLLVGDLSEKDGGKHERHRSHRTGRDVDLIYYAMTPDGRPVPSPGFVRFGPDGLGKPEGGSRWLRLDVRRQWELVKALLQAPDAHVQWIFCARWIEALLVEWALAKGEDLELVWHAEVVLKQPGDSAAHDDHFHVRLACTPEEAVAGCDGGPRWAWLPPLPRLEGNGWLATIVDLDGAVVADRAPSVPGPGASLGAP